MNSTWITILDSVFVLFVGSQSETTRELHTAYAARVLHLFRMSVRFDLVTHEIRHLIETFAASLALVRPLVRMCEHMIAQISW